MIRKLVLVAVNNKPNFTSKIFSILHFHLLLCQHKHFFVPIPAQASLRFTAKFVSSISLSKFFDEIFSLFNDNLNIKSMIC